MFRNKKTYLQSIGFIIILISLIVAQGKGKNLPRGGTLLFDSLLVFNTDTIYNYQITFPGSGYYEMFTRFGSNKSCIEAKKEGKISYTQDYNDDTVVFQVAIDNDKNEVIYQTENKFVCSLNSFYPIFYINTSKRKIPVETPLRLKVKILRLDCRFSYDDVDFYISLRRAGFLR